jgi:polyhydroxyalkanoate synthesis regulator phasin
MGNESGEERPEETFQRELEELRQRLAASHSEEKSRREEIAQLRRELADLAARLRRPPSGNVSGA